MWLMDQGLWEDWAGPVWRRMTAAGSEDVGVALRHHPTRKFILNTRCISQAIGGMPLFATVVRDW